MVPVASIPVANWFVGAALDSTPPRVVDVGGLTVVLAWPPGEFSGSDEDMKACSLMRCRSRA